LITYTRIKEDVLVIPKELIDRYGIDESSFITLVQVDEGILIKLPVRKGNILLGNEEHKMQREVNAIINVLSGSIKNESPPPHKNLAAESKKF
jgi:bifunctional DNA-binding transcriptional regulator/antitoxin component of YhaV-PrlF toxin-antitoxin module